MTADDLALRSPTVLSICTGAGGLDLGIKLARPDARTVCYVEREAFAVANLVAAMEAGLMDEAPIWDDLRTFRGRPWCGQVDWLIGGIPCQPHSTAGKRRGAQDERDLWPATSRVIGEVGPGVIFLENVPGIARYYHERIGPELRAMGYRVEEGLFSAHEVGGTQIRQRLFILACAQRAQRRPDGWEVGTQWAIPSPGWTEGAGSVGVDGTDVACANNGSGGSQQAHPHEERPGESGRGGHLILAGDDEFRRGRNDLSRARGFEALRSSKDVPSPLSQRRQWLGRTQQGQAEQDLGRLFPPGPDDLAAWASMLAEVPEVEPAVCREADGVAWWLDVTANRTPRLRVLGNGVVPLVAAHAFRTLAARLGL